MCTPTHVQDVRPPGAAPAGAYHAQPQFDFRDQRGPSPPPLAHLPPTHQQLEQAAQEQQQRQRQTGLPPPHSTANATLGSTAGLCTSRGTLQWTGVSVAGMQHARTKDKSKFFEALGGE